MEEVMQSLCSNDSDFTEDVRPCFNANVMLSHKTDLGGNSDTMLDPKLFDKGSCKNLFRKFSSFSESDDSNQNELVIDKLISKKENSRLDKHGNIKNKKAFSNNLKGKRQKNKDLEDSNSEDGQYLEIKQTKYLTSNQKESMHLYKEEADSSSGKEFQKSKFSRHNYLSKKVTQSKRINESNLLFMKHTEEKHIISKKQSLCFKSHVIKILNKFKELCSEYELNMEHVKWKHLKKEIMCKESASKVVNKSKSLINKLKLELDMQEKELIQFYKEWNRSCSSHNTDYEGSSSSEDEILQHKNKKEMSNDSENRSKQGSVISECDNEEIFSDETTVIQINKGKHKESQNSVSLQTSKQLINDNDNENILRVTSPILGSKIQKQISTNICTKINPKITDSNETMLKASPNNINKQNINESIEDAFEKETTNNTCELNSIQLKKGVITNSSDCLIKENNTESETVSNEIMIAENISPEIDTSNPLIEEEKVTNTLPINVKTISELIDNKENDDSYEFDAEEEAKNALLESDQETPSNERCPTEKIVTNENEKEQNNKIQSESICKDISSDEQAELTKKENYAKLTLLDSNSDDSIDHSFNVEINDVKHDSTNSNNIRAKVKLLISSNSESSGSNSNSDSEIQMTKIDTSSTKHNKEDKNTLLAEDTLSCNIGIDEKVDKRLAYSAKINNLESSKKLNMVCQVVCDRLSKTILEKHMDALEKSRQYLENKQIKSLVNLDRLQKNQERINSQTRSNLSKKKSTVKEIKDSLLNHLEKIESNNLVEDIKQNCNSEDDKATLKTRATFKTNDELMLEADRVTKNMLLNSSDSDIGDQKPVLETESHESENKDNIMLTDGLKKPSKKTERKDIDEENEDKRINSKWRRNKILTTKFSSDSTSDSDSDSESKKRKWIKRQQKLQEDENKSHTENSDTKNVDVKHKRRNCRKIMNSDSDAIILNSNSSSDSSVAFEFDDSSIKKQQQRIRKRKTRKSDTDTSIEERRPKPKRKRIKNISTDSDDNADNNEISNSQERKSRKNIRKVMKDKQVADDTKQAAKEEEERLKRIAERQKLYNEMYEARLANEEKVEKLVLDFDSDTKAELVSVHEDLVKRLKPHQAKGVKFMWDACFESLERAKSSPGSGCILAHCMGLGKTLQVIALTHTLLTHEKINVNTVMVVCPLSTVLNWKNEFKLWLENIEDDITVYEMTKLKQNIERKYTLENWQKNGGVLIIGYEMFRNLTGTNKRMRKNVKEAILQSLIDPGPDVIICDEGHLLKNEDTALSKSVNRIKTLRRIVLTGTPLQNNLIEYHCMVQFIKPNLLGTKREFLNRFANPITNGQFDDSTEYDVKLMKKRAYVLHKMLKGCVQRFDYSVLTPFLPPKQEYVIFVNLTEVQINMYRYYLENFARPKRSGNGSLFTDFQVLQRIWTHPLVLQLNAEKIERMNEKRCSSDSEGSLRSFIDDSTDSSTSVNSSYDSDENNEVQATESNVMSKNTKQNKLDVETVPKSEETDIKQEDWWLQFTQPEHFEDMRVSSKLVLLFGILKECEHIGDKILVFSQSLYSLTLIEKFLEKIHDDTQSGTSSEYTGSWMLGLDYFRLDGQTSAENRNAWCRIFNRPSNTRARLFLISTRAGGLGINLTAANRVIIFDASWNPSHDVQSIFRIYRFGQKKPCYVYRFLASGTMEEKIYNRQVTKLSLSCRVVDEQQIERHYSNHDLSELYKFQPSTSNADKTLNLPKDRLLAEIFLKYKKYVDTYHEHDSLLENKAEEELNEEERKQAWLEYEEEKKGNRVLPNPVIFPNNALLNQHNLSTPFNMSMDYEKLQELIRKDYPNATPQYQQMMTARVLTDMYNYWEQQTFNPTNQIITQNVGAKPSRIKTQMPNVAQTSYGLHNTNVKPPSADDDIIEILPAATTDSSKGKEE